jgi:ankyrin repeat protein
MSNTLAMTFSLLFSLDDGKSGISSIKGVSPLSCMNSRCDDQTINSNANPRQRTCSFVPPKNMSADISCAQLDITLASRLGDTKQLRRLFAQQLNSSSFTSALRAACDNGQGDAVQLLLADGRGDPTARGQHMLCAAATKGDSHVVVALLKDARVQDNGALIAAALNGHRNIVDLLLEDDRFNPCTALNVDILRTACRAGHTSVVEALLNDGRIDLAANFSNSLYVAARLGHLDIVRLLLSKGGHGCDAATSSNAALFAADSARHGPVVAALLGTYQVVRGLFNVQQSVALARLHRGALWTLVISNQRDAAFAWLLCLRRNAVIGRGVSKRELAQHLRCVIVEWSPFVGTTQRR